jgi:cold shock CspA family protein
MIDRLDGTIVRLLVEKSFGFIRDTDGREYFFHKSGCHHPDLFGRLQEGDRVSFEPGTTHKGLRAQDVDRPGAL